MDGLEIKYYTACFGTFTRGEMQWPPVKKTFWSVFTDLLEIGAFSLFSLLKFAGIKTANKGKPMVN